ncbi:hypothetical protein LOB43_10205 [Lactobacillus delbrueckii subsp. lactis]|nr:hypothetical protein [Lactobacillus delbrueckii]MCD5532410.1 hypothetical protein [Lactobacillus delbrueckii subsp. lactis]
MGNYRVFFIFQLANGQVSHLPHPKLVNMAWHRYFQQVGPFFLRQLLGGFFGRAGPGIMGN